MDQFPLPALGAAAVLGGFLFYYGLTSTQKKLPPGPRRLPWIGNVHQMPTKAPWLVFAQWGEAYGADFWYYDNEKDPVLNNALLGNIFHVDIVGQPFIILNSSKIAKDLMEKRSSIYSDRPHFVGYTLLGLL
jgi:hypothetical protein